MRTLCFADAQLIEMVEDVGWIIEDAIGAGVAEFSLAVSPAADADRQRVHASGSEHVPHRIPDHERGGDWHIEFDRGGQEEIGIRLGESHHVARDDRCRTIEDAEHLEPMAGTADVATRRDRPRNIEGRKGIEQVLRAREWPYLILDQLEMIAMSMLDAFGQVVVDRVADLPEQGAHEEITAHADPAMNAPSGDGDVELVERLCPGEHVRVDAVDQGAIEIEDESWRGCANLLIHELIPSIVIDPDRWCHYEG